MSTSPDPGHVAPLEDQDEARRQDVREVEEGQFDAAKSVHNEITDGGDDVVSLMATPVHEKDDNESISSWGKSTVDLEISSTSAPLQARPLGLSRRSGWSSFTDYDVVTVHGIRDDHQTAWTSRLDNSDWIEEKLFCNLSVRQLDYTYDTDDSARIYNSGTNGITIEANALLDNLAQNRLDLPTTEYDRPIIWICHDLGGSIVKEALTIAMHKQPDPDSVAEHQDPMVVLNMYRRLPLLTSAIIFLGCPHGRESEEELEDQIFALMCLPGPPIKTQILTKISKLARQIERINLDFLDTKILNRAAILNITTGPEKQKQGVAVNETQMEKKSLQQNEAKKETIDPSTTPAGLFSLYKGGIFHTLGIFYMLSLETTDHLGLVRGPDPDGADPFDWATCFSELFNERVGYYVSSHYAFLGQQNSLLSLSPPTRPSEYRFYTDGLSRPDLISWIINHDVFDRTIYHRTGPKTVYFHAGYNRPGIDMKSLSQQLYVAYDLVMKEEYIRTPEFGCFYFEFDQHDSRRGGIRAMITSFVCTYACRFWHDGDSGIEFTTEYLKKFKCWSLRDLITIFLQVQKLQGMRELTIILGQIDQCDEEERSIFLQALLKRQKWNDLVLSLVITTNKPEDFIYEILSPDSIISLDDCPLSVDEYLAYPIQSGANEDRIQRLLVRRPEFAHISPQLKQIFEQFRNAANLQDTVLEWLANNRAVPSAQEVFDTIQSVPSNVHQRLWQGLIDQLSLDEQHIMTHTFQWIKYAAEPLTFEILFEAVRCSLPQEMAQSRHTQGREEFGKFVKLIMGGIILLDGRDIKFSDDAFYEVSEPRGLNDKADQACLAHAGMAEVSLRYLLGQEGQTMLRSLSVESHGMNKLDWAPVMLPRHSLVSYALRFWTTHYQAAGDHCRPTHLATELFGDRLKRVAWTEAIYVTSNPFTRIHKEYISALPYMAMFGLDDLVRREMKCDDNQDGWNQDKWLAITEAARNGHGRTVALLLQYADTDVVGLGEAVRWAANFGEGGALDCLLSKATETKDFHWPPYILERAVAAGLENLVSTLVRAGYDLNEYDSDEQRRAVHTAVKYGQDRVLKILLDSGCVDLTIRDGAGNSALLLAAQAGNPESIRHLIGAHDDSDEGVGVLMIAAIQWGNHEALGVLIDALIPAKSGVVNNKIHTEDETIIPIIEAASRGYKECTSVLLHRGADSNAFDEKGSALFQAVDKGPYLGVCRILLEKGADPNQPAADNSPHDGLGIPLVRATETGITLLAEMLLDHGAKINVADPTRTANDTPLSCAIKSGYAEIVKLLLERGADANLMSEEKEECVSPLYDAAYYWLPDAVEALIDRGANVRWTNKNGWSVLHAAWESANTLSMLLQKGVDVNATDSRGWTALTLAAYNNYTESVEVLLRQTNPKADLEVVTTDDPSDTALTFACVMRNLDTVRLLLDAGADIDHQIGDGKFPLGQILFSNLVQPTCEDIVDFMLKRRPKLALADNDGNTVLHNIASGTPLSVVMRLVEEGAPVNTFNKDGYNPLALAVLHGNIPVARYLTTVKGSQTDVYHPAFGSILHIAAAKTTLEMVRQLVRTGADHSAVDPTFGESVLYSAVGNENTRERRRIIRYLIEDVGVDVNAPGGKWGCPLLRVVAGEEIDGDKGLLKYLLRHGARPDSVDSLGRTAVHWAVIRDNPTLLEVLCKSGANLTVTDNYGRTPLHFAATKSPPRMARYIIDNSSNGSVDSLVEALDVDGWTPLMWACRAYFNDTAQALVDEYKADMQVRSKVADWSLLKLARYHQWSYDWAKSLVPDVDAQDDEDSRESQYYEQAEGSYEGHTCLGCEMGTRGQTWICPICTEYLCFKCIRHSGTMHNSEHTFVDLEEYQKEQAGSLVEADHSGDGSESDNESDNEDQDQDDTETEEEEEDDSE